MSGSCRIDGTFRGNRVIYSVDHFLKRERCRATVPFEYFNGDFLRA